MHRLATGRLVSQQVTAGSFVIGTVPAGHWWQVLYVNLQLVTAAANRTLRLRARLAGGTTDTDVFLANLLAPAGRAAVFLALTLSSGDSLVFVLGGACTANAFVSYIER